MNNHSFYKFILPLKEDLFEELSKSVDFEDVAKGRKGNHLVNMDRGNIPIVRTTTKYLTPAQQFSAIHRQIAESIKSEVPGNIDIRNASLAFNNALIEIYEHSYAKMNYHSDQCLDLEEHSCIALYSCYEHPEDLSEHSLRKLKVKSKTTEEESEFTLENNSVILFSLATNTEFMHKIVLEPIKGGKPIATDNRWLGITFRQSKTFIHFKDNLPYFQSGELLTLADEEQSKEFYKLRGQENNGINFVYPDITYTLSIGDTLMLKES